MTSLKNIFASVQSGNAAQTAKLVAVALAENNQPFLILREGIAPGIIGMEKKYQRNDIFETEILAARHAMKAGLEALSPAMNSGDYSSGTVVTGTLEGDIHETEKNIISAMMQSLALNVIDMGISVSSARFVEAAANEKAGLIVCGTQQIIFLSKMKALVHAAEQAGIRRKTKILLSGGPVTEGFCKIIGADIYAPDPLVAAEIAAEYCKKNPDAWC